MSQPIAYLRKSKVTSDRHVSWEAQEADITALAARHGDTHGKLLVLSDWSKSGRESKTRLRPDYLRLKQMIAEGKVGALYSYSLSRLARSTKELLDLAELCAKQKVPIRLAKEGDLDFSSPHGRLYLTVLAAVATFEAEVTGERTIDAVRARRERGDVLGIAPYGWTNVDGKLIRDPNEALEPIVAAYRETGSCYGAARLLNQRGSRTRRGATWTSKVVGDVLQRAGVTYRRRPNPGAKGEADWALYRLLTCPYDSHVMTTMDKRSPRVTCWHARHDPDHARPFGIAVSKLLPAIRAEADKFRLPKAVEVPDETSRRREVDAKRERVIDLYVSGIIDKRERDRRLGEVADELEIIDAQSKIVDVPERIDWDNWSGRQINAVLRTFFERIELGPDLRPARFVWRLPDEYHA